MTKNLNIGSSVFNADHGHLADAVMELEAFGVDYFHFDVFDGHFIPDLGFPPQTLKDLRKITTKPFNVHLCAMNCSTYIKPLVDAGADLIHLPIEGEYLIYESISKVKQAGIKAGVSITVGSPVESIFPVLPFLDGVLVLGRAAGEAVGTTSFLPLAVEKIRILRQLAEEKSYSLAIEVAGSLTIETAVEVVNAGADWIAFGKSLHKTDLKMGDQLQLLRQQILAGLEKQPGRP